MRFWRPNDHSRLPLRHRQELFLENYFESQRDKIFRNVQVLIYVFDIESRDLEVATACRMPRGCSKLSDAYL